MAEAAAVVPRRPLGALPVPAIIIGLWQVAGGHGKINLEKAVQEMKIYADAGFDAFDLADICGLLCLLIGWHSCSWMHRHLISLSSSSPSIPSLLPIKALGKRTLVTEWFRLCVQDGPSEEMYGRFLREQMNGCAAYGLTKFVPRPGPMSRNVVDASINRSMQKMGVSCLDMVQFHWWDYEDDRYLDATKALTELKTEGKVLEVALTNFDTYHMNKILISGCPIVSNQVAYSIIDTRPEKKMVPWCLQNNVKILAYGTLLGGFLAEKYVGKPEPKRYELNTSSLAKYKYSIDQWGGWSLFQELLLVLKNIAEKYSVSISNVAVRYITDKPAVGSVIVGARLSIAEHIADNLRIFSFSGLDATDLSLIHSVVHKGKPLLGDCGDEYRMNRR